jgi:hypothetical protein
MVLQRFDNLESYLEHVRVSFLWNIVDSFNQSQRMQKPAGPSATVSIAISSAQMWGISRLHFGELQVFATTQAPRALELFSGEELDGLVRVEADGAGFPAGLQLAVLV